MAKETKLVDFGQKIGGARKDVWKSRGLSLDDLFELTDSEAKKYVTKENVWPKPEEQTEPEAEEKETTTVIKIGGFSFTVKASEYYALIDDIRDNGIFEPAEIRAELQRRILND